MPVNPLVAAIAAFGQGEAKGRERKEQRYDLARKEARQAQLDDRAAERQGALDRANALMQQFTMQAPERQHTRDLELERIQDERRAAQDKAAFERAQMVANSDANDIVGGTFELGEKEGQPAGIYGRTRAGKLLYQGPAPKKELSPGQAAVQSAREQRNQQALSTNYQNNPIVKEAYGVANAISGIRASATGKTPANDLAMIYSLVKFLDPGSVVREGEINLTRAARSLGTQVVGAWQKASRGNILTEQERKNILGLIDARVKQSTEQVAPVQSRYGQQARRYGVDSAFVAPDPFDGVRTDTPDRASIYRNLLKPKGP